MAVGEGHSFSRYITNGKLVGSKGFEPLYSTKVLFKHISPHILTSDWDLLVLNKRKRKVCIRKRKFSKKNIYLSIGDAWKKRKCKRLRVLYLRHAYFSKCKPRYVAPFQYYIMAVVITLFIVVLMHIARRSSK